MSSDGTQGPVIIEGIKAPYEGNEPPMRLELRDMIKDYPDQWNLYLLALERFQAVPEDQPLSYFQIAGTLETPFPRTSGLKKAHNELYKHAEYIAKEFEKEGKTQYVKVLKTFRMPYWDWARPELPLFPKEALSGEPQKVERPKSQKGNTEKFPAEIKPLARYMFGEYSKAHHKDDRFKGVIKDGVKLEEARTVRTFGNINDKVARDAAIRQFTEPARGVKGMNISERILFLLQGYEDFGAVSNNGEFGSPKSQFGNWGSIEDVHNAVHDYIGGDYMGAPAWSAFDPIFWLHHTNIDRLFAIWQACNPGKYVTPQQSLENTVVRARGSPEDADSPLTPFARSVAADGTQEFWTSAQVKDTKVFGYIYPETQSVFNSKKLIINEVDRLYLKRASFANILRSQPPDVETLKELQERAKVHLKSATGGEPELPPGRDIQNLAVGGKYLEWLVNIRAEKAELNGNYIVNIFLGDPDSGTLPLLYVKDHAHVGSFATFGQDENSACENCQKGRAEKQKITGQIPLTIALVERYLAGQVDSLKHEDVVKYLKANLRWKITLLNGDLKSPEEINNLLVCVVSNEVTFEANKPEEIPVYSDVVTSYPEITHQIPESFGTGYDGSNF
ncbi:hypothetical protein CMEL01_11690 [Colletotrichum melonis]|uniref:tyrosinase n=1 Tax=Colletotrichum melonis TaxID=1209925 RepID=A0AAI9UWB9_9PEZI|nr:hypothetical protein CMEL01_11690 [Colletotrichum melonis]